MSQNSYRVMEAIYNNERNNSTATGFAMAGFIDKSDQVTPHAVSFDYTSFLCQVRREQLGFFDAIKSTFQRFSTPKSSRWKVSPPNDAFASLVSHSLSSLCSDVLNLTTLVQEAQKQHIQSLTVFLPYSLDDDEIESIQSKTGARIEQHSGDREFLKVTL